jgi:large subunit ribosomal protein L4e
VVKVFGLDGQQVSELELPKVFSTEYRPDVIRRAFLAVQSARRQSWGPNEVAGMRTSAETWGKGFGVSRVPRVKGTRYHAAGRAALVPHATGGRKAHPPKPWKKLRERINRKERQLAISSAISATREARLVKARGHLLSEVSELPLIVKNDLESLSKTKEVKKAMEKLGLWKDVERVAGSLKIRAGKGKMRGRRYKQAVGPLIVVGEDRGIARGAKNLPGVEVCTVFKLGVKHLAPGGVAGRLTLWTEHAIEKLSGRFP